MTRSRSTGGVLAFARRAERPSGHRTPKEETLPTTGLQDLADSLASQLGRSVTVVNPEIRILCASAHFGDEDDARVHAILQRVAIPDVYRHIHAHDVRSWTGAGHVPAAPPLGFKRRLVLPVRQGTALLALVMIIDDPGEELTRSETVAAEQVAALMAGVLERDHFDSERRRSRRKELIADLVDDHDATRERAVQVATESLVGPTDHITVLTLIVLPSDSPGEDRRLSLVIEASLQNLSILERSQLDYVVEGRATTIASVTPEEPSREATRALAQRAIHAVESLLGGATRCVAGLPAEPTRLRGMRRSRRQSRFAAEAAALLPQLRPIADFADLGVYGALLRIPREELDDVVPAGVRRLLGNDPRGVLRETLQTFLDEAGSVPATAERLKLHRTSLYYRLRQIQERTGLDIHRGEDRLMLHLGLRAVDVLDAVTAAQSPGEL
jgi:sugar diacid utilization regulator